MSLIEAHDLSVSYHAGPVLSHVTMAIRQGEIVTVIGPNGSGKSTLLRAILGAIQPSAGRIVRQPGLRIGYVPQRLEVDATMPLTVARFLQLPVRHAISEIRVMLARVGIEGLENRQITGLSGGQFQRALLARALIGRPDLLVLDEPTQALDQRGIAGFYHLLEQVRHDLGCAVLLVSHDLHVVMAASDQVICLNGHVCCQGAPSVVSEAPEYRALFGEGTDGTMALYQHSHDHSHHHDHDHDHDSGDRHSHAG